MEPTNAVMTQSAPSTFEDELDFRDILGTLIVGRWLLLSVFLVVTFVGAIYLWVAARSYKADALLQVEQDKKPLDSALGQMSELLGKDTPVTAEIEIIRSRMVLGKVVDELNLALEARPRYFPKIGQALARGKNDRALSEDGLGWFKRYARGGESIKVSNFTVPDTALGHEFIVRKEDNSAYSLLDNDRQLVARGNLDQRLDFNIDGGAGALFIQNIVGAVGREFVLRRVRKEAKIAALLENLTVKEQGKQSGILTLSFEDPSPSHAAEILNSLASAYQRQNVERKSAEAAQTLSFLDQQLPQLRKALETAEGAMNTYRLKQGSADLTKETDLILQQSVALERSRFELEQKRQEALRRFTASHPVVEALDAQMAQIERDRRAINGKVKDLPETQQELLRLSRDLTVNTTLYTSLLNSSQELQLAKAGTVGNVRIIDFAYPPRLPSKPHIASSLALAMVFGLILGVVAVFVRKALHSGIEDPAEVERALGLPTYGSVPFSPAQSKIARLIKQHLGEPSEHLLAINDPQSLAIESLRSLRTALHFGQLEAKNNILMLTGPAPSLGKSFIAANFGTVLAAGGKRVVVVDCDVRRGTLHQSFTLERTPGLSDFIAGTAQATEVIQRTPVEQLFCVPTGVLPPNPAELLLSAKLEQFLAYLSKHFDTVILDTPPILAVTDAAVIGRFAGTTLMVLKSGEHSMRMIEDSIKRLQIAGVSVRGSIFNQAGLGGRGRYGYKYGYSYGYYQYDYGAKAGE